MKLDHVISANSIVPESLLEGRGNRQVLSGKIGSAGNHMIRRHEFRHEFRHEQRDKQIRTLLAVTEVGRDIDHIYLVCFYKRMTTYVQGACSE